MTASSRLDLDRFIPYRLSILANTVSDAIEWLYGERFGLTIPMWRVIAVLGMTQPLSANQVGARTRMDKVRVSRAVQRLLGAGLIARVTDSSDRRRADLHLTKAGEATYAKVAPLARETEAALVAPLDDDELNALDRMLDRLQAVADDLAAQLDSDQTSV